ncbi:hypothetical protein ABT024_41165, partial [Streptomyces sp. NPDC002812]
MAQGSRGGAGKSLVRATLAIHEPPTGDSTAPGGLIRTFDFDFNPAQLSLSRRALWKSTVAQIERDGPLPEFMGSEPREMNLEIFLWSSGTCWRWTAWWRPRWAWTTRWAATRPRTPR